MRKKIATILIISLIFTNTFIARADLIFNNGVEWREYATKMEVYAYYASMSELLESLSDVNTLTPLIEKNPMAKYIKNKNMKQQEKQD